MPRPERAAAAALLALLALAGPLALAGAKEKTSGRSLEAVEQELERGKSRAADLGKRAAATAGELAELRQKMIDAASATQEAEEAIGVIERKLAELRGEEKAKTRALGAEHGRLALTLEALVRLALYPPEALAALPESPVDSVRSALLLRTAVPQVEARAVKLRADLAALLELRREITSERRAADGARRELGADRVRLSALLERKTALYRELEGERQGAEDRIVKLAAEAKDLRELMARIERERKEREEALANLRPPLPPPRAQGAPKAESKAAAGAPGEGAEPASLPPDASVPIRPISEARGLLTLPARGEISKEFGEADAFGATSKGITIRTGEDAEIVAPYDGKVVYAGPFRGYGQILIIEHSEGYHSLLAGLSRVDAAAGQWVLAGEPVGAMGEPATGDPELYMELRQNGRPINPLPWLALHKGKVNG